MITKILELNIEPTKLIPHHRFNSWQHCYQYFCENHLKLNEEEVQDTAALHLGFYLASWGMMRGSTELLQRDYRIHLKFIQTIAANPKYHCYYSTSHRQTLNDEMIDPLFELIAATRECYAEFNSAKNNQQKKMEISDTLVTKILLGVFGNVPAYDRFFISALKSHGLSSSLNKNAVAEIIKFFNSNEESFTPYLSAHYTPMKLVDMYFWQVGFSAWEKSKPVTRVMKRPKKALNQTEKVREYVTSLLIAKKNIGLRYIDLRSGDIHANLNLSNRLPIVCAAMKSVPSFRYETIKSPPKGNGSNLVLRYFLE